MKLVKTTIAATFIAGLTALPMTSANAWWGGGPWDRGGYDDWGSDWGPFDSDGDFDGDFDMVMVVAMAVVMATTVVTTVMVPMAIRAMAGAAIRAMDMPRMEHLLLPHRQHLQRASKAALAIPVTSAGKCCTGNHCRYIV
jgi:hypothetical protein